MSSRIKSWYHWAEGQSIFRDRSPRGQVILKKKQSATADGEHRFLLRLGSAYSEEIVGTRDEALNRLEELVLRMDRGILPERTQRMRLETFLLETFLPWKRASVKPKTYAEYQRVVLREFIPNLGAFRLAALNEESLDTWVEGLYDRRLTKKTLRSYTTLMKAALRRAYHLGLMEKDIVPLVTWRRVEIDQLVDPAHHALPGVEIDDGSSDPTPALGWMDLDDEGVDQTRVWTAEEVEAFVGVADIDDEIHRWILLAILVGLRPGEQCALMWDVLDLDVETPMLTVRRAVVEVDPDRRNEYGRWILSRIPKNGDAGRRQIVLTPESVAVLERQQQYVEQMAASGRITKDGARFVFPSRGKKRSFQNPDNLSDRVRWAIDGRPNRKSSRGLPGIRRIPLYGFRHTHATALIRAGWDVISVAKRLGTSSAMIEKHYGHWLPDVQREKVGELKPVGLRSLST